MPDPTFPLPGTGERPAALAGAPLLIAHRGGAGLAPENTLDAFRRAATEWGADMIELDVRASADGHCVVIHDPTVDRTTDGTGAVAELTLEELRRLDAGYRFAAADAVRARDATDITDLEEEVGGAEGVEESGAGPFPWRARGVRIPTIDEVLEALPDMRFTVEVKAAAAQRPLLEAVRRHGAGERVVLAGEREADRTLFHEFDGATSASSEQGRRFYILHRLRLALCWAPPVDVVQMPEHWNGRRVLTPRLVRDLHRHGIDVHVWTVNEEETMRRLLDWGVDGIVTDRPDRLGRILADRRAAASAGPDAAALE